MKKLNQELKRQSTRLDPKRVIKKTTMMCLSCGKSIPDHDKNTMFICLYSLNRIIRDYRYYKSLIEGTEEIF